MHRAVLPQVLPTSGNGADRNLVSPSEWPAPRPSRRGHVSHRISSNPPQAPVACEARWSRRASSSLFCEGRRKGHGSVLPLPHALPPPPFVPAQLLRARARSRVRSIRLPCVHAWCRELPARVSVCVRTRSGLPAVRLLVAATLAIGSNHAAVRSFFLRSRGAQLSALASAVVTGLASPFPLS